MQRVTNCILNHQGKMLMLKKPRRGWYVAPGGKMEQGEHIQQAVVREFYEETGLTLQHPQVRGVFTFLMKDEAQGEVMQEWMMFTFYCEDYSGQLLDQSSEGDLEWVELDEVVGKPMAEGDRFYIDHILASRETLYGTFTYTSDFKLLDATLTPKSRK
ncbi:8-oxo-dGTP diphosphatase [Pontibacillus litoralis]|uniref:NUDIX hydrolase n=1 Tax=Pontibacillus litoralis JSM 072002 TaxID=1385512 RepID=A0A0A5G4Y2_9BACI|nr:8-oxo-dGTP diphosphatase [Pontibacillus litoralis]KGX86213.1 NUDIX hydrolase [Pontibacillus litoralis JSM 072002]